MNTKLFRRTSLAPQTPTPRRPAFASQPLGQRICASWILPLLVLTLPATAHAQYNYTTNNGTITITGYTGPGGAVTIPSMINGLPVTSLGDSAFYFSTRLTSMAIPTSVTSLGDAAFQYCTILTNVTIPSSVTNIGAGAFFDCSSLIAITVNPLNSVYSTVDGVLFNSSQTTLIQCPGGKGGTCTVPASVTNIGAYAFYHCASLTAITVTAPNPIYSSVDGVLFKQSQTTLIQCPEGRAGAYTIPSTVTSIGDWAFSDCTSLTGIAIGSSVTNIGYEAFYDCSSLTAITVDAANAVYSSVVGVLFDKSQTTLIQCPEGKAGSCTIPSTVTHIGSDAFYYCRSLTAITVDAANSVYSSVDGVLFDKSQTTLLQCPEGKAGAYTIPSTVTNIASEAFYYCASLTNVTIPKSVTSIGSQVFTFCSSLTAITVDAANSVYSSADGVLFDKNQTTLIQCPEGKTGSCPIPNSVTSIGDWAFYFCISLTSVTLGNNVTNIGVEALDFCTGLTGAYFRGNAPSVAPPGAANANHATAYYLPGTAGWGPTFDGLPTALWKPQVLTGDSSFGVRTNQFGFNITWSSGMVIVVEACTNLANPTWSPLQTNTLSSDSLYFSDPRWTNYPGRFYRLRWP